MNVNIRRQSRQCLNKHIKAFSWHIATGAADCERTLGNTKPLKVCRCILIPAEVMALINPYQLRRRQTQPEEMKPGKIVSNGIRNADDTINPGVQEGNPGFRVEVADVTNNTPVRDDLDRHSFACPQCTGQRPGVKGINNVVFTGFQRFSNSRRSFFVETISQGYLTNYQTGTTQPLKIRAIRIRHDAYWKPFLFKTYKEFAFRSVALICQEKNAREFF